MHSPRPLHPPGHPAVCSGDTKPGDGGNGSLGNPGKARAEKSRNGDRRGAGHVLQQVTEYTCNGWSSELLKIIRKTLHYIEVINKEQL